MEEKIFGQAGHRGGEEFRGHKKSPSVLLRSIRTGLFAIGSPIYQRGHMADRTALSLQRVIRSRSHTRLRGMSKIINIE
ncbi:hypothetical protein FRC20_002039 [Serendipita sp. 405]|nr:hypothetical protein FRC20_002039 [Serendipita sp. 405]